jgi:DNA invertase Pin-like site-specific DNA recombinase
VFCEGHYIVEFKEDAMARMGYARGNALGLNRQLHLLASCDQVYQDEQSGSGENAQLTACMVALQPGDTLVVTSLDRLGRQADAVDQIQQRLKQGGIKLEVLS